MKSLQEYINESELKTDLSTNKVQPKTKITQTVDVMR